MSTMDYLEFKNYLEHSFTQKDKAKEYEERGKKEANLKERRYKDTIREKALSLAKTALEYNNTYDNASPYNIGSKPYSTYGGQATAKTEAKKARDKAKKQFDTTLKYLVALINKYPDAFFNDEKRYLEKLENENGFNRQEYVKDLIDKIQMQHFSWDRQTAAHSSISHASKAGMPTSIKKDQQAQIRKEIIKRIDAYKNSAKFSNIRSEGSALGGKFSASNNTNMRGGGYTAKSEMRRASAKGEAADYKNRDDAYNALLSYISKVTGSAAYSGTFSKEEMELISSLRKNHPGTASDVASKLRESLLSHDNLEHGWFTDLFKKSYTAKGSTAGMPTNLPRTATSGGSAGSKQLVYSDQLRKLNTNLVEYELKMNQAKASYEEYRKLYNDTKKNIANTEKALTEATKEAARTGFDPSKSSVAPQARRYASSNAILPQTTITGSTEGLKKTRYHVKKKK